MTSKKELYNLRIDIRIVDTLKYRKVCYLLDNPKLLNELKIRRAKLGLEKLVPYESVSDWLKNEILINSSKLIKNTDKNEVYIRAKFSNDTSSSETSRIISKLHLSDEYWNAIHICLLTGQLRDADIPDNGVVIKKVLAGDISVANNPYAVIQIYPYAKPSDIKHALRSPALAEYLSLIKGYYPAITISKKKANDIKRDREWYWIKFIHSWSGLYREVRASSDPIISDKYVTNEAIRQAVLAYTKYVRAL